MNAFPYPTRTRARIRLLQRAVAAAVCLTLCVSPVPGQPTETDVRRAIAQLDEGDWIQRWGAMQVLGEAKANDAIAPLRRLHSDERQPAWLRGRALVALAHIQPAVVLPLAAKLAEDTKDKELQAAAVEALGVTGVPRAKDTLLNVLKSDNPAVRDAAVEAYARVAGKEAMPFLEASLRSEEPAAVRHAVRGLSYVDSPEARARLWELVASEDEATALEAVGAAARLQLPAAIPALLRASADTKRERIAAAAQHALVAYPEDALAAPLAAALRDGDATARSAALEIVKARPSAAAVQAVGELAATDALEPPALAEALTLMGEADAPRFRDTFIARLAHESADVRRAAVRQVDRAGADVFALVRPLLLDADAGVRADAAQALLRTEAPTPEGGIVAYLAPALQQTAPEAAASLLALVAARVQPAEREAALRELTRFLADMRSRNDAMSALNRVVDDDAARRAMAAAMGFVDRWRAVGPFGAADAAAERIEQPLPPEADPASASYRDGDRDLTWVALDRPGGDGVFDPRNLPEIAGEDRRGGILVVTTTLHAAQATPARLTLNSNGAAVTVQLNGARVATRRERGEISEPVQLAAGANRLLVKLGGQPEAWIFSVRLSDEQGNAIPGLEARAE